MLKAGKAAEAAKHLQQALDIKVSAAAMPCVCCTCCAFSVLPELFDKTGLLVGT